MKIGNLESEIANEVWLPDMDLNHDKVIQSHLCYRYTIGQTERLGRLNALPTQSSRQAMQTRRGDTLVVRYSQLITSSVKSDTWRLSGAELFCGWTSCKDLAPDGAFN